MANWKQIFVLSAALAAATGVAATTPARAQTAAVPHGILKLGAVRAVDSVDRNAGAEFLSPLG